MEHWSRGHFGSSMTRNGGYQVDPGRETGGRGGSLTGVTDPRLRSSGEKPELTAQHVLTSRPGWC